MIEKSATRAEVKRAMEGAIKLAQQASVEGLSQDKISWERRAKYFEGLLMELRQQEDGLGFPKRAFVSYSRRTGAMHFSILKKILTGSGFEVKDGFQSHEKAEGKVLKTVLNQLKTSTVFIGVLTRELQFNESGKMQWAPSVWSIEEVGMAIAIGIPYTLLIQDGIHEYFWSKVTPDREHIHFNDDTFEDSAREMAVLADNLWNAHVARRGQLLSLVSIRR